MQVARPGTVHRPYMARNQNDRRLLGRSAYPHNTTSLRVPYTQFCTNQEAARRGRHLNMQRLRTLRGAREE